MGLMASKNDSQTLRVVKEYSNIACCYCDPSGQTMFLSLKKKEASSIASTIYKINCAINKTIDFYTNKFLGILSLEMTNCSKYIVIQTSSHVILYNLELKKTILNYELVHFCVTVKDMFIYIQISVDSILRVDLDAKVSNTHKINCSDLASIRAIYIGNDPDILYIIGPILNSENFLVARFDIRNNILKSFHKSTKQIQKLQICDNNNYVIASKLSGTITLYDRNTLENKKNLRYSGSIVDIKLMGNDTERFAACYEINNDVCVVFWNLITFSIDKKMNLIMNFRDLNIRIIHIDKSNIYIQNGTRIIFFGENQKEDESKERYVFDENNTFPGGEPMKLNSLSSSRNRDHRPLVNINTEEECEPFSLELKDIGGMLQYAKSSPPMKQHDQEFASLPDRIETEKVPVEDKSEVISKSSFNSNTSNCQTNGTQLCWNCKVNPCNVIFHPCKHSLICQKCVKTVGNECLLCQSKIQRRSMILIGMEESSS
jgi:hypothetical protein